MRVVMTLLCRDEEDIIDTNVRFHLEHGVDHIIITDNGSKDGTVRILQRLQATGQISLLFEPTHNHDQSVWVTRMARLAKTQFGADWVINGDADEFYFPASGNLRKELETVPDDVAALRMHRTDFLPPLAGSPSDRPFYQSQVIRQRQSLNALGKPLPPKTCHRGHPEIEVADGNHYVSLGGEPLGSPLIQNIDILHFPVRSFAQFSRKIRNGTEALCQNPRLDHSVGRTWRHLYHEYWKKGRLEEYYRGLQLSANERSRLLESGDLLYDRRLLQAATRHD